LLATRSDRFVARDTIMRTIGGAAARGSRRCADMHVCRIRRKLRDAGAAPSLALETVYGRGYALRLHAGDVERSA
jgi:DNA-binding response OmpR family regulator